MSVGPAAQLPGREAVTVRGRAPEQAAPQNLIPSRGLPGAVPTAGRAKWRGDAASLLCTEAFTGEGSEFMDHREVQIESSENAAGARAWRGGCSPDGLPGSAGALVPVP